MKTTDEIPALITYLSPMLIVENDSTKWSCTLEEVNTLSYDVGKLATIVGSIDVGLPEPLCLHIGLDGALILPLDKSLLPVERAADFVNRFLAQLCLGGVYSDAVTPEDFETCKVIGKCAWYFNPGKSARSFLHGSLKYKAVGSLWSIYLLHPRKLSFSDIVEAHHKGHSILGQTPALTPEFLIRGVTGLKASSWSYALAELWICVEQMTSILWERAVAETAGVGGKARKSLLDNHQSWPTSVRQEVLFQRGFIDECTYSQLMTARKARNDLSHRGIPVDEEKAVIALNATIRMLGLVWAGSAEALMTIVPKLRSTPYTARRPDDRVLQLAKKWAPVGPVANSSLHPKKRRDA